jgi:hypothetical protein
VGRRSCGPWSCGPTSRGNSLLSRLFAAIVDRLTFAGPIIETGTTSYRLAHARAAKSK